jgi:hypothetical protein
MKKMKMTFFSLPMKEKKKCNPLSLGIVRNEERMSKEVKKVKLN